MKISHLAVLFFSINLAYALPENFVYLNKIDPSIQQDMRYAGDHNFIGRPVKGYDSGTCILMKDTAQALAAIQRELRKKSLSLKVYDCYRPTMAVADFIAWSRDEKDAKMKREFYPRISKVDIFRLGYVAEKSQHSRGSTVDLTIVPFPVPVQADYKKGQALISCYAPYAYRFHDNSIDMGTGYDCLDESANPYYVEINSSAYKNRMILREVMMKQGFIPSTNEWWHFTLEKETYPQTYFNFRVR